MRPFDMTAADPHLIHGTVVVWQTVPCARYLALWTSRTDSLIGTGKLIEPPRPDQREPDVNSRRACFRNDPKIAAIFRARSKEDQDCVD